MIVASCGGDDAADAPAEEPAAESPAEEPAEAPAEETATTSPAAEAGTGADGGTLIWAHEQEPPDLHLDDPENNLSITSWIRSALLEGLFGISGGNDYYPELLADNGELVDNGDGTYTANLTLRDGLVWSDGTPLTTADVVFTFDAVMAQDDAGEYIYLAGDRSVLETIGSGHSDHIPSCRPEGRCLAFPGAFRHNTTMDIYHLIGTAQSHTGQRQRRTLFHGVGYGSPM